MEFGAENATRLVWRSSPDLLLNEESLVDVISKLRGQVQALERNELLSGTALPSWLVRALTDVANNVDAVVECQALHEQVNGLQKEILELRHELLLQQSTASPPTPAAYNPTPYHRQSTGGLRPGGSKRSLIPRTTPSGSRELGTTPEIEAAIAATAAAAALPDTAETINHEIALKPLWDAIHKQTNSFSSLRSDFLEAKQTVTRLQAEIKRRDAVIQARNAKHESVVQSQVEKLNESLRSCVTRNDMIAVEQRIAAQMKQDRQHVMDEVESRSNKIVEDLLASRADQEDINSTTAEQLQTMLRKHTRMEEQMIDLMKKHTEGQQSINEMRMLLAESIVRVDEQGLRIEEFQGKVASFEETQRNVEQLTQDMKQESESNDTMRTELEDRLMEKIGENVAMVRGEINAVNNTVNDILELNLDSELKSLAGKLDVVALNAADCTRKLTTLQKQVVTDEEQYRTQFTQVFDSIDRVLANMSTISEESMRISYNLNQEIEHGKSLDSALHDYKQVTDQTLNLMHRGAQELQSSLEKHIKTTDNEIGLVKNQLFHLDDATSTLRRDLETTQHESDVNLRNQLRENQTVSESLETLSAARDDLNARQDAAQAQMFALQAENRAEIQASTAKMIAIVDKESDRVEALYASFQEKQDHFADVVARSSIRNMDLTDMNREIDRVCEIFVTECWKFETSARSSNKASARTADHGNNNNNAGLTRKLFNERQQQLLAKNCQFFADILVARAEYEVLHAGCNREVKNQNDMEELMIDSQMSLIEKMKAKIQTKIMNNKNIGEQFDKSTLDRRELYIETLSNMVDAAMKRRTLGGNGRGEPQDVFRDDLSLFETQQLVVTSHSAAAGARRKSSARRPTAAATPGSLGSDLDSSRPAFTPASSYVYRAGFRLPKAGQSPPASPGSSIFKGSTPATPSTEPLAENPIFLSTMMGSESSSEPLQGWSTEDSGSTGMSKSISLPALRQQ